MIACCGKPRSGTTSVAAALSILGYNVLHYCPLTTGPNILGDLVDNRKNSAGLCNYDALVSWRLTPYLEYISQNINVHKIILLDRNDGWESSCLNMGITAPQLKRIRLDFAEALTFCNKNNKITSAVMKTNELNWERLCYFLGKPIPDTPFPHKNKLKDIYQI